MIQPRFPQSCYLPFKFYFGVYFETFEDCALKIRIADSRFPIFFHISTFFTHLFDSIHAEEIHGVYIILKLISAAIQVKFE